ncbi:Essential MCU regulator, mitochondrial [Armadillidium nasatum]|uniref:Essential MCU regulator, mitochondrial n=1 Tax=Armadillidium nasatum TaxID=96803 RepID=A0A5N5TL74_9CRUS|nr:Essential MCU regulator, mitochondrial [Armadillidium nasatum]
MSLRKPFLNLTLISNRCRNIKKLHVSKVQYDTFTASDAVMPQPNKTKFFSYIGAGIAITVGVTTGALISKNIASFLEENDLFVPSDDDDDD